MKKLFIVLIIFFGSFAVLGSSDSVSGQAVPCPTVMPTPPHTRSPLNTAYKLWSTFFIAAPTPGPTTKPCTPTSGGGGTIDPQIIGNLKFPGNLGPENSEGYYQMPIAPNGEYDFTAGACPDQRWGSRELVGVIYTVALAWKEKYPGSLLVVGDLNASHAEHASHHYGKDVDIYTSDSSAEVMASPTYTRERATDLGKMFMATGLIEYIFFNDSPVQEAVNAYARQNNLPGTMMYEDNHHHHFHVRLKISNGAHSHPSC